MFTKLSKIIAQDLFDFSLSSFFIKFALIYKTKR